MSKIQKKITDVFTNLLRGRHDGDEEEHEALLQSQQEQQQLEEAARATFRGLKWTRVISMQDFASTTITAWDLSADVVEELQHMAEIEAEELP